MEKKIRVMVNGLPGKMARAIVEAVNASSDMELIPFGLTGPERPIMRNCNFVKMAVKLYPPDKRGLLLPFSPDIVVDFTTPLAIEENVKFYTENSWPFVLGTTSGDFSSIEQEVAKSRINALVAPNMAREIVGFQMMVEDFAKKHPNFFEEYNLEIVESHQKTKRDTSGTAKAMVSIFNRLGLAFSVEQIEKKRTEKEYEKLGVPPWSYDGHGYHTYTLKKRKDITFQFSHNVNGRGIYVSGTLDAIRFLHKKRNDSIGKIYTMFDLIKGK